MMAFTAKTFEKHQFAYLSGTVIIYVHVQMYTIMICLPDILISCWFKMLSFSQFNLFLIFNYNLIIPLVSCFIFLYNYYAFYLMNVKGTS